MTHHVHQKEGDQDKHPCLQSEMIAAWLFRTEAMAERTNSQRVTTIDYMRQGGSMTSGRNNPIGAGRRLGCDPKPLKQGFELGVSQHYMGRSSVKTAMQDK